MGRKPLNIQNIKIGKLTPLSISNKKGSKGEIYWLCSCECGNFKEIRASSLFYQTSTSCGCVVKTKEIVYKLPEYATWLRMKDRCFNTKYKKYKDWGGRGITVCDEWKHDFYSFFKSMGRKPSPYHSLDRINNNGNYEPSNCRWAIPHIQNRNYRRNVLLKYNGVELCAKDWATKLNINPSIIYDRVKRGWSVEKTLTTAPPQPVRKI